MYLLGMFFEPDRTVEVTEFHILLRSISKPEVFIGYSEAYLGEDVKLVWKQAASRMQTMSIR
jgi:hypothetical protein